MRIIGGEFKGRRIAAPKGMVARPTTDRTRESLFNILAARDDIEFNRARIIDLFAGSGALGLEALSRGGGYCLFVEQDAASRAAIRDNIEALGLFGRTRIHRRSATALGRIPASTGGGFDFAFLDPPYREEMLGPALDGLYAGDWLAPGAVIITEQASDETPPENQKFSLLDRRSFGDTMITILRCLN